MKYPLAAIVLAALATSAQAQFKCTGPDGSVAFQQTPCPSAATSQRLNIAPAPQASGGRLAVGMSVVDVLKVMGGAPARVNKTITSGVEQSQWIYERGSQTIYVYVSQAGDVVALQDTWR